MHAIKCINFINLVLCSVYTGFYAYGVRNAPSFPWKSYNRLGYSLFLFIGIFYAIVGICGLINIGLLFNHIEAK